MLKVLDIVEKALIWSGLTLMLIGSFTALLFIARNLILNFLALIHVKRREVLFMKVETTYPTLHKIAWAAAYGLIIAYAGFLIMWLSPS